MLNSLRQQISRLIALYEAEKTERIKLQIELEKYNRQNEAYRTQIAELDKQIDNLKLTKAFTADGTDNAEARKKIDKLMKEIDKCISLMEG